MPLPPLHVTAVAWLHFWKRNRVDLAALTIGSTAPDLEPLFAVAAGLPESHAFFHSLLWAVVLSPVVALVVWILERRVPGLIRVGYNFLRLKNPVSYPFGSILLSSLVGMLSHVFFDMWTHETFRYVLYPRVGPNPFWFDYPIVQIVESMVLILSAYSVLLWVRRVEAQKTD